MLLAGGQEFGVTVNPIQTRGVDYAYRIITWKPNGISVLHSPPKSW